MITCIFCYTNIQNYTSSYVCSCKIVKIKKKMIKKVECLLRTSILFMADKDILQDNIQVDRQGAISKLVKHFLH